MGEMSLTLEKYEYHGGRGGDNGSAQCGAITGKLETLKAAGISTQATSLTDWLH
jgi:hypothetical protein